MKSNHRPMRSIWQSLLWKEWQEHKWKLLSLFTLNVFGCLVILYLSSNGHFFYRSVMTFTLVCYGLSVGMFLGMSTAGRENGRGTMPFLKSQTVPMWQPGIVKLGIAIFTAVVPVLGLILSGLLFRWSVGEELIWNVWSGTEAWSPIGPLIPMLGIASLLLWMMAAGSNRRDEVSAGACGFLVVSAVWILFGVLLYFADTRGFQNVEDALEILAVALPGGIFYVWPNSLTTSGLRMALFINVAILGHGCVLVWYLCQFGKGMTKPKGAEGDCSQLVIEGNQVLAPPMRNQLTAIAWKQMREIGPIALLAVTGIVVLTMLIWAFENRPVTANTFGEWLASTTLAVALLVTVVVGIGAFFEDLKPRVDDFWRSRPTNYPLWFGVKFFSGMFVLVLTFGTLGVVASLLVDSDYFPTETPRPVLSLVFMVLVFMLIYALSMASYSVVRQPIYAVIVTIGLMFGGTFAIGEVTDVLFYSHERLGMLIFVLTVMSLSLITATAIAWRAVQKSWGIKA